MFITLIKTNSKITFLNHISVDIVGFVYLDVLKNEARKYILASTFRGCAGTLG